MQIGGFGLTPRGMGAVPAAGAPAEPPIRDQVELGVAPPAPASAPPARPAPAPASSPPAPAPVLLATEPDPEPPSEPGLDERRLYCPVLLQAGCDPALARRLATESRDPLVRRLAARHLPAPTPEPPGDPLEPLPEDASPQALVARNLHPRATAADRDRLQAALSQKQAFEPHLADLSRLSRSADVSHDEWTDFSRASLARQLMQTFPEIVTPDFFQNELMLLAREAPWPAAASALEMAREQVARRPELRDLMVAGTLEGERLHAPVLLAASELGWKPQSNREKDFLAQWLFCPGELHKQPLLPMLAEHPELYKDCQIPGPDGALHPLPHALVLLAASEPLPRDLAAEAVGAPVRVRPEQAWHKHLLRLIGEADPEPLLAGVEAAYRQAGSLNGLNESEGLRLALVSTLPGTEQRLASLLSEERDRFAWDFNPLVDRLVRTPRRREILTEMGEPDRTMAECVALGRESLTMTFMGHEEKPMLELQARLRERIETASPVASREQARILMGRLQADLPRHRQRDDVPTETLCDLALLTPFLQSDPELRQEAGPILAEFGRVDRAGYGSAWTRIGNELSRCLMGAIAEEIPHLPASAQRPRVREALKLAHSFGSARGEHLSRPLAAWKASCHQPLAWPDKNWFEDPVAWLETGMASVGEPRLQPRWAEQAAHLHDSRRAPQIDEMAASIARDILPQTLERLGSPEQTMAERSRTFALASDLVTVSVTGGRDLREAFDRHAAGWEKSLVASTPSRDAARLHWLVSCRREDPAAAWEALRPVVAAVSQEKHGLARLIEALGGRPLEPDVAQYGNLVSTVGAEHAPALFSQVKDLEKDGLAPQEALTRVVRRHLKLEAETGGGLRETSAAVTLGGVQLRKRPRL